MKKIIQKFFLCLCCGIMLASAVPATCLAHWLPETEYVLGGIGYGCTMGYVRSIYGEPMQKKWFNNDGFRGVQYIYSRDFSVTARVADNDPMPEDDLPVKNVRSALNNICTPTGIAVGIPVTTLTGMYGKGEKKDYSGRVFYYYKLENTNRSMSFYINNAGFITEIIYAEEW